MGVKLGGYRGVGIARGYSTRKGGVPASAWGGNASGSYGRNIAAKRLKINAIYLCRAISLSLMD